MFFKRKVYCLGKGYKKSCIWTPLRPLIHVWWRSIYTISWVWVSTMGVVNTMSSYIYHNPMCLPWVAIYTISPCLYHESMSIPWVHVYTMTYINASYINTEIKWQTYRNTNYRNIEMQITEVLAMGSATLNSPMFRGGFLLA